MRIKIQPKQGILEQAVYFSCENHRVITKNIVSNITFWTEDGRLIASKDMPLTTIQYSAWCQLGENDPDEPFFLQCHMDTNGLVAAPIPEPEPDPEQPPAE